MLANYLFSIFIKLQKKFFFKMFKIFRNFLEKTFFGVSSWWGEKLNIKPSFIRLFFIYAAFANALTIFIYLIMVFILRLRNMIKYKKRKSVFDL
tara:strand:- start:90 stop:371 length:282 start_codon:yes stop_codon:yes gene_type:complete